MEDDEDEIYGSVNNELPNGAQPANDMDGEEGEALDDEDSDSDIDIITERQTGSTKPDANAQPARPGSTALKPPDQDKRQKSHSRDQSGSSSSPRQNQPRISKPDSTKPGTDFPGVKTSSLDPNGPTPDFTLPNGDTKRLTDLDFDADLAEHTKPWRLPGTDRSDYFNYGFDEFTWATYCLKQQEMRGEIKAQKEQNKQFEMMFGMPGMPPMPPMPGANPHGQGQGPQPGAMPGMPNPNDPMMQQMMQHMMANGMNPMEMDPGTFMQQFQAMQQGSQGIGGQHMAGGFPPTVPAGPSGGGQQQGGYDGGNRGGYGGGRRGPRQPRGWA